jgi:hypothetical protein
MCCMTGCIQSDGPHEKALALSSPSEETSPSTPVRLEVDYDSELNSRLFKARGSLVLWGNRSFSYLLLNATLLKDGRPLCSTKYMMIDVMPNRESSFDISKSMRLWPGSYACILDVSGPEGQMASETRQCRMAEPFFVESQPVPKPSTAQEEPAAADEEEQPVSSGQLKKSEKGSKRAEERDVAPSDSGPSEDEGLDESLGQKGGESKEASEDREVKAPDVGSEASLEGMLVGSTTSNKYHRPGCRYAAKIRPENRVYFASEEEAKKQGYLPCKTCNP